MALCSLHSIERRDLAAIPRSIVADCCRDQSSSADWLLDPRPLTDHGTCVRHRSPYSAGVDLANGRIVSPVTVPSDGGLSSGFLPGVVEPHRPGTAIADQPAVVVVHEDPPCRGLHPVLGFRRSPRRCRSSHALLVTGPW